MIDGRHTIIYIVIPGMLMLGAILRTSGVNLSIQMITKEEGEEEFGHGKGENRWEIRRQGMRMEWQGGRGGRTERKRKSRKRA